MKSAVYSWRVSPERKAAIEQLARKQKRSVAELIDQAVAQMLERHAENEDEEQVQRKLRQAARRAIGQISGGDPDRAAIASIRLREKLRRKRVEQT
jgi:predicted transcriptional regulator